MLKEFLHQAKSRAPGKLALLISVLAGLVGFASGMGISPTTEQVDAISKLFSEATQNQITQAGFCFTLAAWLHAGRVKKEIRENFAALTESIDKVALAFRDDLKAHAARLDNLSERVTSLESNKPQEG